jgi:predicted alpha/beta-fold hydrolase
MDTSSTTSTALTLFGAAAYLCLYWQQVARPKCEHGNAVIKELMNSCPSLQKFYWPPPHFWNAHAQFVPYMLRGYINKVYPRFKWFREQVVLPDGELMALDWVISTPEMGFRGLPVDSVSETPILMIHHGAMCDSSDMPGQDYIEPALKRGWFVCVLNRRGHGDFLRRPKWNFFGCVQDVRCATQTIVDRRPKAKLLTVGLSSGTALVATIFGYGDDVNHFHAGVGVCPGYSIDRCMARFCYPYMVKLYLFYVTGCAFV